MDSLRGKSKTIMLLVTYKCNLHCSYCYEPKQAFKQMSVSNMKQYIIAQYEKLGNDYDSFEIQFMGGEPLLVYPMIKEISEWLWQYPFKKQMKVLFAPTNGTLLTDEMKFWLFQNKHRFCLGLSFDGDHAMQNINRSDSSPNVDLDFFSSTWPDQSVKMTVSPQTISNLADGVLFLFEKGFKDVVADLAVGERVNWEAIHLNVLKDQLEKLVDYYVHNDDASNFSLLNVGIEELLSSNDSKACSCGEDFVCIDTDGQEYACHLFSPIACNLDKARKSQDLDFSNHSIFSTAKCNKCFLKGICKRCAGMNYISTDDVACPDAFQCNAFKIIFFANCKLQYLLAVNRNDTSRIQMIEKIIESLSIIK